MNLNRLFPYAAMLLALVAGIATKYAKADSQAGALPKTEAFQFHPPRPMPDFSLLTADGQAFNRVALQGQWSLLYFGYTHCPDACPTTLADLNRTLTELKRLPQAKLPRVYFISVDPQRDNPKLLREYTRYFNPGFTGVTGDVDELKALAKPLGVDFSYDPPDAKGDYNVNHAAAVILVDPRAEQAALFFPSQTPAHIAADYRAILDHYVDP
jgi:protein SCO1/2